jgi:cell division protein FtsB
MQEKEMKGIKFNKKHIIIVAVLILSFLLVMDLNTRLADLNRLTEQRDLESTKVAHLYATQNMLHTQIAYATSEVAVEEWAREKGRLTRPGEVLVVPIPPGEITPGPMVVETPTPEPVSNIEVWRALFFGE